MKGGEKPYMIISIGTEKKKKHLTNLTLFHHKTLRKIRIEGKFPNMINSIYEKPTANIMSSG